MHAAIVFTVSVLASPGTPSSRRWPLARRPNRSRSTKYFWPTTTCPTCWRSAGIHWPSSRTSCVVSCVDFIRCGETRTVRRMFDQRIGADWIPAASKLRKGGREGFYSCDDGYSARSTPTFRAFRYADVTSELSEARDTVALCECE